MTGTPSPRGSRAPGDANGPARDTVPGPARTDTAEGRTEARGHTGGNAEDCPICRPQIDQPGGVLYPWLCTTSREADDA